MQNTWIEKNNVAQFQEANWDNWIGTKACGSVETAREYADLNAEISFFFLLPPRHGAYEWPQF